MNGLLDWGGSNYPGETFLSPAPRSRQRAQRAERGGRQARGGRGVSAWSLLGWTLLGLWGLLPLTLHAVLCPGHQTPRGRHRDLKQDSTHLQPLKGLEKAVE